MFRRQRGKKPHPKGAAGMREAEWRGSRFCPSAALCGRMQWEDVPSGVLLHGSLEVLLLLLLDGLLPFFRLLRLVGV